MDQLTPANVSGRVIGFRVFPQRQRSIYLFRRDRQDQRLELPDCWVPVPGCSTHNLVMYEWTTIVGNLLQGSLDKRQYHLAGMYIEFENNGGAIVTPPTNTDRGDGRDYYDGLLTDPNRDYLRVPMNAVTLESTDDTLYPGGNKITSFAQTAGIVGVHGKPYNDSSQSRVFGGALIATPQFSDATQDMIFSRFYFDDPDKQMIKLVGSQVGLKWPITLT